MVGEEGEGGAPYFGRYSMLSLISYLIFEIQSFSLPATDNFPTCDGTVSSYLFL